MCLTTIKEFVYKKRQAKKIIAYRTALMDRRASQEYGEAVYGPSYIWHEQRWVVGKWYRADAEACTYYYRPKTNRIITSGSHTYRYCVSHGEELEPRINAMHGVSYEPGFHLWKTLDGARRNMGRSAGGQRRVVLKCVVKGVIYEGTQWSTDAIVARDQKILKRMRRG